MRIGRGGRRPRQEGAVGEDGAAVYEAQHKSTTLHTIAGTSAGKNADTIGCGDIFGAAFLYRYCAVKNFADAGAFAVRIASGSVRAAGEEKFTVIAGLKEAS